MIKVKINQEKQYSVEKSAEMGYLINDITLNPDVLKISNTSYHIISKGKSYNVVLLKQEGNKMELSINGNIYNLDIKDKHSILLEELGIDFSKSDAVEDIKAPMPGLVLKLLVSVGEEVKKDSPLLILEAMKMENVIKSPGDGIVKNIKVKERDAVEKGAILIEF